MWKRTLTFIALIAFLANAQIPLGPCFTATAVKNLSSANITNSCNIQPNGFTAGLYGNVSNIQNCGVCLQITGPTGTVIATITDTCTGNCPGQNLVVSSGAYNAITNSTIPPLVQYQIVSCTLNSSLQYTIQIGSSQNWFALQVTNSKIGITKVEISDQAQGWISLDRQSYNYWSCSSVQNSSCANFQVPLSVRITGSNGQVLTDNTVLTQNADWPTNQDITVPLVYPGTVQFTQIAPASLACNVKVTNPTTAPSSTATLSSATSHLPNNSTKTGTLGKSTSQIPTTVPITSAQIQKTSASHNLTTIGGLLNTNTVQNSGGQILSQVLLGVLILVLVAN